MAPGPIWETTLFLPSLPSPSSSHPPRAPILPLTHLSLRAPTNKPIGLDDLAVLPGMAVPTATELLWRGVVELDQKALRWVRPEAIASLGLGAAQGARVVRVTVQGRWRMCTFDDNYSTELRAPDTDALVMHTRSNKRYQVLSMEAMCYSRSRAWLERALLVNFVILCGRRWSGENQSVPWLVNKYKELHKRPNPSLAFFTTDIYHVLAAHASYLKDYWQRARWRHAEYAKRVRIELGAWEQFWRRAEGMREKVRREGRTWGRKREVGAALGVGKKRARRKSPPGGSAKKRRVDPPAPSAAAAPTPPETARKQQQPIGLFGKPPSFGRPATSKEPAVAGRSGGSRPRGRGTVEEIDLSGEVVIRKHVSAGRRRSPSPSSEVDLDLTMADSDDEELVEPVRGLSLRPPAEQEQGSEEEVEGLFTPPPGRPADVDEERQKSRVRSGGGEKSVHERERWTTPAQGIQPFVPRERPKPSVLETKNEMPACFTHRPILSPSYAWRCPYPSCVYEMDFLRPSAQFRDSLTQEEVAVASGVHAAHTSSRLNGVFYIKVMQHYQTHLGELKVQWPVRLRA